MAAIQVKLLVASTIDLPMEQQNCRAYALKDFPKEIQTLIGEYRKGWVLFRVRVREQCEEMMRNALRAALQQSDRPVKRLCARWD